MKTMYAVRYSTKGQNTQVIRYLTEAEARSAVENNQKSGRTCRYIGKVKVK